MGDGDGWVRCAAGHKHWGRFGAAGLMIRDDANAVLQHRAEWTHEGGTWALPGGARDSHEDVLATALREAGEEAAIEPETVLPTGLWVDDHGGWSYTTVTAVTARAITPRAANSESNEIRWWPTDVVHTLALHSGFANAWAVLRTLPAPLHVVVDGANVVGARPDGWWRDRPAAARRLAVALTAWTRRGVGTDQLPAGLDAGALARLLPRVDLVLEGRAVDAQSISSATMRAVAAPGTGDDEVLARALAAGSSGAQVLVVTADRGLRGRLPVTVTTAGPSWLWAQLDAS